MKKNMLDLSSKQSNLGNSAQHSIPSTVSLNLKVDILNSWLTQYYDSKGLYDTIQSDEYQESRKQV